jgi:hypothetical protein
MAFGSTPSNSQNRNYMDPISAAFKQQSMQNMNKPPSLNKQPLGNNPLSSPSTLPETMNNLVTPNTMIQNGKSGGNRGK